MAQSNNPVANLLTGPDIPEYARKWGVNIKHAPLPIPDIYDSRVNKQSIFYLIDKDGKEESNGGGVQYITARSCLPCRAKNARVFCDRGVPSCGRCQAKKLDCARANEGYESLAKLPTPRNGCKSGVVAKFPQVKRKSDIALPVLVAPTVYRKRRKTDQFVVDLEQLISSVQRASLTSTDSQVLAPASGSGRVHHQAIAPQAIVISSAGHGTHKQPKSGSKPANKKSSCGSKDGPKVAWKRIVRSVTTPTDSPQFEYLPEKVLPWIWAEDIQDLSSILPYFEEPVQGIDQLYGFVRGVMLQGEAFEGDIWCNDTRTISVTFEYTKPSNLPEEHDLSLYTPPSDIQSFQNNQRSGFACHLILDRSYSNAILFNGSTVPPVSDMGAFNVVDIELIQPPTPNSNDGLTTKTAYRIHFQLDHNMLMGPSGMAPERTIPYWLSELGVLSAWDFGRVDGSCPHPIFQNWRCDNCGKVGKRIGWSLLECSFCKSRTDLPNQTLFDYSILLSDSKFPAKSINWRHDVGCILHSSYGYHQKITRWRDGVITMTYTCMQNDHKNGIGRDAQPRVAHVLTPNVPSLDSVFGSLRDVRGLERVATTGSTKLGLSMYFLQFLGRGTLDAHPNIQPIPFREEDSASRVLSNYVVQATTRTFLSGLDDGWDQQVMMVGNSESGILKNTFNSDASDKRIVFAVFGCDCEMTIDPVPSAVRKHSGDTCTPLHQRNTSDSGSPTKGKTTKTKEKQVEGKELEINSSRGGDPVVFEGQPEMEDVISGRMDVEPSPPPTIAATTTDEGFPPLMVITAAHAEIVAQDMNMELEDTLGQLVVPLVSLDPQLTMDSDIFLPPLITTNTSAKEEQVGNEMDVSGNQELSPISAPQIPAVSHPPLATSKEREDLEERDEEPGQQVKAKETGGKKMKKQFQISLRLLHGDVVVIENCASVRVSLVTFSLSAYARVVH